MSKLYRVLVSFEYVALADSAAAAEDMVDDMLRDRECAAEMTVRAFMLRSSKGAYPLPEGYDVDSLVYGDAEKRPLGALIAEERHALEAAGKQEGDGCSRDEAHRRAYEGSRDECVSCGYQPCMCDQQ